MADETSKTKFRCDMEAAGWRVTEYAGRNGYRGPADRPDTPPHSTGAEGNVMELPKTVQVLKAKDICRGYYDGPNGTHCIVGWVDVACVNLAALTPFMRAIRVKARTAYLGSFNECRPKSVVASTWNRAMVSLGYIRQGSVFVMPECK
jgi:hypothetical protein